MDRLFYIVEEKIHIIHKTEKGGGKFGVDPIPLDSDDVGPFPQSDDFQERLLRYFPASIIAQRFDGMPFIRSQGGNTVWLARAGEKAVRVLPRGNIGVS